ncbi:hypothetical protein FISHEDRAFT_34535 [Fistulina hepatica ATCC 64428]|uniref:D-serine dehydratase n=1 Tax=Fistulina hepatica ATCC 64428 TaxID=1128425 RepID=A0A0D7ALS0_9AGAR|nr:hypothetical protein FISHEDRAFT_34535 [Fistulina hepatica ATCC 64428]
MAQTATPIDFAIRPRKNTLVAEFVGKPLDGLRTPALIIDRDAFARNCAKMHQKSKDWGAKFRAHLKTHKTAEGTALQLKSSADKTTAVVVSTLMEAWEVVNAGLFADGTVGDLLYGLPVAVNKLADLSTLWDAVTPHGGIVRVLIDHPEQIKHIETFETSHSRSRKWSAFIKIDGGQKRAGVNPMSERLKTLVSMMDSSPAVELYGFYGHAGNAYGSKSLSEATSFLSGEVVAVNTAAKVALSLMKNHDRPPLVLSVGSTPSAHAASAETKEYLSSILNGTLELHAGNYPMLDIQQRDTTLIGKADISQRVRATVISYYPGRAENGWDEAMVDAGVIAFSKDTCPSGGFGEVIGKDWKMVRMSQEHGILASTKEVADKLDIGETVDIVGNHACLIAAAFPWYYVVDETVENGTKIVDIWVPWKGW